MKSKKVLIVLADGFEETEAVAPADVLRRLGYDVVLAGLDSELTRGSHGICVKADCKLADVDLSEVDAIMLPGGMPGSTNLRDSDAVMAALKKVSERGGIVSAICAAPIALARAGLVQGRTVTGYPGTDGGDSGLQYSGGRVERDGKLVTGKAPGAAFEFAAELATALGTPMGDVKKLLDAMFVEEPQRP